MRRLLTITGALLSTLFATLALALPASAGSPHFVSTAVTVSGNTLTVHAKEAGLGGEAQIVAVLSGTASCINPGDNKPKAGNKTSFSTSSTEPVQNGMADYTLTATATFSPECSPPMTVQFTAATLTDQTNNLSVTLVP